MAKRPYPFGPAIARALAFTGQPARRRAFNPSIAPAFRSLASQPAVAASTGGSEMVIL
jgi:hypothetical protein